MAAAQTDTRLQWFGSVPEHWKVARNKNAFRVVSKPVGERSADFDLLSLTLQGVKLRDIESGKGKFPASFETYQEVLPGDIVFCLFDVDETPRTVGLSPHKGMVTGAYTVVRCSKLADPRYVTYFYLSIDQRKGLRPFYTGLRKVVRTDTFLNATFPLPGRDTQKTIADFLDCETARIDQLIEKKQRLVELLTEKNEVESLAIVTGAECTARKDSKIIWARSIPSHWQERAVWMLFELGRGRVISHDDIAQAPGPYPIYSSQTANDGVLGHVDTFDFEGDYLTWTTDGAKAGTVFRRSGKFNCTNVCGTLKPLDKNIDLQYFQFALDRATDFFVRHDINPKLMNGVMSKIRVPFPPYDEQQRIGSYLKKHQDRLKPLHNKIDSSTARLREFRAALITAAVTGRIDVTTWGKKGQTDRRLDEIEEAMHA